MSARPSRRLSHLDARGAARMVDVGGKPETARVAIASAAVLMTPATLRLVRSGAGKKGDVLAAARLAAIAAVKRTPELIPLCHPIRVLGVDVELAPRARPAGIRIRVTVRAFDRTGAEMEAMVGAAAAALTIYDMAKAVERGMRITELRLDLKSGGRSGTWRRGQGT